MKSLTLILSLSFLALSLLVPNESAAVPSYARQTGLACSGCHYTPPELNPAGRRFKLTGYVDRGDETKVIKQDDGKKRAALDLLESLPLSIMLETSFTSLKTPQPNTQDGNFEFPQDISLFLSGAWTSKVGSFLQVTYNTQSDHFSSDNTDIRYANKTTFGGKELIYGIDLNNNPTVEDLWNSTPAWGYPFIASDNSPTPNAGAFINGGLAQDVAGLGGFFMWDNHVYMDLAIYRSEHVGGPQPNPGVGAGVNIRGVAPYWRLAFQQLTGKTQYEIGTYGMHMRSTPNEITDPTGASIPTDSYTDWGVDTQIDRTMLRTDVLSFRATYIRENNDLLSSLFQGGIVSQAPHRLNTAMANAEYHLGNKYTGTIGWFNTTGTSDLTLYPGPAAVTGNFHGDPRGSGYIMNVSCWPWQNLQLAAQYIAYTRFNGAQNNYDGFGRSASGNNTLYLDARIFF